MLLLHDAVLRLASLALILLAHGVASYFDVVKREIPDKVWVLGIASSLLTLYQVLISTDLGVRLLYAVDAMLGVVMFLLMFLFRFAGGADAKSILLVSLSLLPRPGENTLLTVLNLPVVAVTLNSLIGVAAYTVYVLLLNRERFQVCEKLYMLRSLERLILRLSAVCVTVREVLENSHKLSPILGRRELRSLMVIEYRNEVLQELVREGLLRPEDHVLAVYYVPYIVCITVGLALYVVTRSSIVSFLAKYFLT